jgi:hypothetical protein
MNMNTHEWENEFITCLMRMCGANRDFAEWAYRDFTSKSFDAELLEMDPCDAAEEWAKNYNEEMAGG